MNVTLQETQSGDVTVRLVERACSDFVILYLSPALAAISHRTTDRADAHKWFATAVEIAEMGFVHPAWKASPRNIPINITNGE
jgi:hypothetical protein